MRADICQIKVLKQLGLQKTLACKDSQSPLLDSNLPTKISKETFSL